MTPVRTIRVELGISFPAVQQRRGIGQVIEKQVGLLRRQLLARMPAGGDSCHSHTNGPSALNVERRVANDPRALTVDPTTEMAASDFHCFAGDIIAVHVLVAEPAEGKMLVQPIMP